MSRTIMKDGLITCPHRNCECKFCTHKDLQHHLETHWKETKKKNGWIMDASMDPILASVIINSGGSISRAGYRYVLLGNGKVIFKTKEDIKY